jgi:hypothetical protein
MINLDELLKDLKMMYEYTFGAHHASDNENASAVLHTICHRIENIMRDIIPGGHYHTMVEYKNDT